MTIATLDNLVLRLSQCRDVREELALITANLASINPLVNAAMAAKNTKATKDTVFRLFHNLGYSLDKNLSLTIAEAAREALKTEATKRNAALSNVH